MKTLLMKTRLRELKRGTSRAGLFLMFLNALGQIVAQPTVTIASPTNSTAFFVSNTVVISANASAGDESVTNVELPLHLSLVGALSHSPHQLGLTFTNSPSGHPLRAPVAEWAVSQFPGEAGNEISYRLAPQVRMEAGANPANYSAEFELRASKPNNIVQSKKYPGIEYSGILVQAVRNNPLQLINPFAPASYGDGEANRVRNPVPREAEGLKLWQISF